MIAITLADLRFRGRQFLIAVVGAALLFAISLQLSGLADSYPTEARRVIDRVGATSWLVPAGSSGPFTSFAVVSPSDFQAVAGTPGVTQAAPVVTARESVTTSRGIESAIVIAGGLRGVPLASGRAATAPGEIVADQTLHVGVGGTVVIQGATLHVVGVTHGETIDAGFPIVVLTIDDARTLFLGNQPIQNAVVITGTPASLPPDLRAMSNAAVLTDALRPLKTPLQTLRASRSAMWVIAALIVAALLYVSVLERVRDFAVLKSLGASSASLFSGIAIQAVIVTILAAVVSVPTANGLKPLIFPEQFAIPRSAYLVLPLIAVGVGLLSSLVGLRRATGADPSLAFG